MPEPNQPPRPDPALRRLDRLVGSWTMEGNLVGSDEKNITGETTFTWLPGGFFLEQRVHIDFMGMPIDALELIGYDPESDTFPSTVFSGFFPTPLPYRWDVRGRRRDDLRVVRSTGLDLHRCMARGRHLRGRLASESRRRRDGERAVRHRRPPARMSDSGGPPRPRRWPREPKGAV
jgi:Protein of unknown function (DUF1579)